MGKLHGALKGGSGATGRDMAANLCRRYTGVTLRELSERLGLSNPDSASDLIRRESKRLEQSQCESRIQRLTPALATNIIA